MDGAKKRNDYGVKTWSGPSDSFLVPFLFPPLLDAPESGLAVISDPPAQHPANAPHAGLHVPAQGAGAVEIVAGTFRPLRLDVEDVAHADRPLYRDDPGEGVVGLGPPSGGREGQS